MGGGSGWRYPPGGGGSDLGGECPWTWGGSPEVRWGSPDPKWGGGSPDLGRGLRIWRGASTWGGVPGPRVARSPDLEWVSGHEVESLDLKWGVGGGPRTWGEGLSGQAVGSPDMGGGGGTRLVEEGGVVLQRESPLGHRGHHRAWRPRPQAWWFLGGLGHGSGLQSQGLTVLGSSERENCGGLGEGLSQLAALAGPGVPWGLTFCGNGGPTRKGKPGPGPAPDQPLSFEQWDSCTLLPPLLEGSEGLARRVGQINTEDIGNGTVGERPQHPPNLLRGNWAF